jgi:hypothetical protein
LRGEKDDINQGKEEGGYDNGSLGVHGKVGGAAFKTLSSEVRRRVQRKAGGGVRNDS